MATYNGLPYVREQLASILSQIESTDQLVVVDDASDDGTWEYLRAIAHPALELVRHASNQGIRTSFEDALNACRHAIVFLSDQDDVWLPDKREAVLRAFAASPGATAVISDARLIDQDGRVIGPSFMDTRGGFKSGVFSTILKNRYLGCAMSIRRQVLSLALPVPRGAPMHDMWLGAMAAIEGTVVFIDEPLLLYRRHGRNASPSTPQSIVQMTRWRIGFVIAIAARLIGRRIGPRRSPPAPAR